MRGFREPSFRVDPVLLLKAVKPWVKRAPLDLEGLSGNLLDALRYRPTVPGLERDGLKNQ